MSYLGGCGVVAVVAVVLVAALLAFPVAVLLLLAFWPWLRPWAYKSFILRARIPSANFLLLYSRVWILASSMHSMHKSSRMYAYTSSY